jgi:hypothetical protein
MTEARQIRSKGLPTSRTAECNGLSSGQTSAKKGSLLLSQALGKLWQFAARTILVISGCAAVAWGLYALPIFARQASIERVATHVIGGDPFRPEVLAATMAQVEAAEQAEQCRPAALRNAAIIRTRFAEQAIVDGEDIDANLSALQTSVRRSLACSPTDPFLWVVLYWVECTERGFQPNYVEFLRLSYRLGPNEGWIGLRRNGLTLAIFGRLPPDIAEMAIKEFAGLLDSGFFDQTIAIITGPGWAERDILLPRLETVRLRNREVFAKMLYRLGYDAVVPDIVLPDHRPWD